ncbi:MAG: glycosyltransferase [Melioribacter sp.]|nr:glycosyltransferase [Melioribacter sp.]
MENDKIKILQVIEGMDIGGEAGGAERFSLDLSLTLDKSKFDVSVLSFYKTNSEIETKWLETLRKTKIPISFVIERKKYNRFLGDIIGIISISKILKNTSVDIIHSHFHRGTIGTLFTRLHTKKRKLIRTVHLTYERGYGFIGELRRLLFVNFLFPLMLDAEVAVSRGAIETLNKRPIQKITKKQGHLIYNAIPVSKIVAEPFNNDEKRIVIGTVARLAEQKGLIYLVNAAKLVCEIIPNVTFEIVGEGKLRNLLIDETKRLQITDKVIFKGKNQNVAGFLEQIKIFVLPSLWEGLPTVIMEAMAAGVPVIATNIPGTDELIRDGVNGILVPARDSQALAEAIITVLNCPEMQSKYREASLVSVNNFSIEKIAGDYERLFEHLVKRTEINQTGSFPSNTAL